MQVFSRFSRFLFPFLPMLLSHCNISTIIPRRTSRSCLGRCRSLRRFRLRLRRRCGRCRTRCLCFCRCWRLRLCRSWCFCWRRGLCRLRLRRFCRTARRTLLRTRQIVADHRSSCRNIVKDRLCNTRRQVDTAVGTARLVNRTAKTASPLRIMHTDTIIERHPVINRRPVIFTLQDRIFLLICQPDTSLPGFPSLLPGFQIQNPTLPPAFLLYRRKGAVRSG